MAVKKDAALRVHIPTPNEDRAIAAKVGVLAIVGFVVGVAWPRLIGFHVGPNPPSSDRTPSAAAAPASASAAAPASSSAAAPVDSAPSGDDAPSVSNKERVTIGPSEITACKDKKGDKAKECGTLAIDKTVLPKLAGLNECSSALGLEGEMTLGLNVDFDKSTVDLVEPRKSGLPSSTVRGIVKCASDELKALEIDKIPHTHARYSLDYHLKFFPPGAGPEDKPEGDDKKADGDKGDAEKGDEGLGKATVAWEKALVRDSPKDGKVVARFPQGTRVKILQKKDDWYEVSTDTAKGWVYRSAVGK